jgi:hypothetical protein
MLVLGQVTTEAETHETKENCNKCRFRSRGEGTCEGDSSIPATKQ